MKKQLKIPQRKPYQFLPENFSVTEWAAIQPYYEQLLARELSSPAVLRKWLLDRNELEGALSEDFGRRYINMTRDTANEAYRAKYETYVKEIVPQTIPLNHRLNEKVMNCPHTPTLSQEAGFDILLRCIENGLKIYRTENVPLMTALQLKSQEYGQIAGAMTVQIEGQELTLQQAAVHLEAQDRDLRQKVYEQMGQRRLQDKDTLEDLYTTLIKDRHQIAVNAGFENFRDYSFVAMNRFDYTPQDCLDFHEAVATEVVPLLNDLARERKEKLNLTALKPWDTQVDPAQKPPLRPFNDGADLLQKTIHAFDRLDPFLGNCLRTMEQMGHLDLESRKGKAPGGYNYPLDETGVPFIFMNATATLQDMITMIHEGGHAVHSFLVMDLELNDFKHPPSELAELASMSMELLTMDHWDLFFEDEEDLKRAKKEHLVGIIHTLAWVATIDAFQHWVYTHPGHTLAQREAAWLKIFERFASQVTDWSGQEHYKDCLWQKQLHLFEVPFYYIEYGIAQLGAVAVWKCYQENPAQGLQGYLNALQLGYTRSVPHVYEAAGIAFDFSRPYIRELMQFLQTQLAAL
ncbi:MAG: M3 family oligoendopeptidase [Bacteroidota bacterium]